MNNTSRNKKRATKLKRSGLRPWRMIASIILFIAAFIFFPYRAIHANSSLILIAGFFLFFQGTAVAVDLLQGRIPLKPKTILTVFSRYVWGTFLEILFVLFILPVIAIEMVLSPFMSIVFLLSIFGLILFFVEEVLKIDIKGVISFLKGPQTLLALGVMLASGFILTKQAWLERFIDNWVDKAGDIIVFIETGQRKEKTSCLQTLQDE